MSKISDINHSFSQWYQDVVYQSKLVDQSPVKGCFVIRPYGYKLWENIKKILNQRIEETGHENAIFPLLIPESFLKREKEHIKGFSPELVVVTHAGGKKLVEPLVIRSTSETIVHHMFSRWIKSWRDLPIKINQWANVVRWEMRTRPFLRTTEFFWQEGHTAHETAEEAEEEALLMLHEYVNFMENTLAIPVITGRKSESEKFPGAEKTFTVEAIMQDGKALQIATSHIILQQFCKSFNILYQNRQGKMVYPYLTSWGATTRMIGALVMVHGDQNGLVLPPKVAPIQVVIIPILKKNGQNQKIIAAAKKIKESIPQVKSYIDLDDQKTPGAKFYEWECKGVPIRIEIGLRDLEKKQIIFVNRLTKEKEIILQEKLPEIIQKKLEEIQNLLLKLAIKKREKYWNFSEKLENFGKKIADQNGLYQTGWCGSQACEEELKKYKATIRCLLSKKSLQNCFYCDQSSQTDVIVAKAY